MKDEKPKNEVTLEMKQRTISEGLSFLLEMEQVSNKAVINALVLNIQASSPYITRVELLPDQLGRKMLIFLELSWWGRLRYKRVIADDILNMLQEVLPAFEFRVVYDYQIFEKALKVAEKLALLRGRLGPRV